MPDSTHSLLTKLSPSLCQALWGIPRSAGHSLAFRSGVGHRIVTWRFQCIRQCWNGESWLRLAEEGSLGV